MRFFARRKNPEKWFQELYPMASHIVSEEFESEPHQLAMHSAWLGGGIYLASRAAEELDSLKELWGNGSSQKALSLSLSCTMYLISWFYYSAMGTHVGNSVSQAHRKAAAKASRANIASLFELTEGEYNAPLRDKLDEQFWYEIEDSDDAEHPSKHGGTPVTRFLLLGEILKLSCGGDSTLDWASSKFPKRRDNDLVWRVGSMTGPAELMILVALEADSFRRMMAIYRELNKVEPPNLHRDPWD